VALTLALAAGVSWALSAPPRGWWPLFPIGVALLTVGLYGRGLRGRLVLGALTGLVHYGTTLAWLTGFTPVGYGGVVLLESALLAAAAGLAPTGRSGRWSGGWWTLPAALTLLDAAQTRFPFDGFPLPSLVFSQLDGPFVLAAPLGGALLVTLLAAAAGVALASLVLTSGPRRLAASTGVGVFVVAALLADGVLVSAVATEPAGVLDVAVVQGGGPRGLRAVFTDPSATTQRHLAVAGEISDSPDLVLLPETVIVVPDTITGSPADATIAALARRLDAPVVVGVAEMEATRFRNAAVLWGPDGSRQGRYEKEHRVPFGEYIPGRALLEQVTDLTALVPRDAVIGDDEALLQPADGPPLGVVISYEILFADRVREAVTAGGQIVLVPTNAASYVTEDVPAIELAAARLRAREFGRTVVQAAPTGYTAVVRADGEVTAVSGLSAPALLRENVELRTGLTPYARLGDVPFVTLAIVLLLAAPLTAAVRRRSPR
jgi:apolipoprotein N-acyltransferase